MVRKVSGKFVVLEGIDGAGTTTQARLLAEWLVSTGRPAVVTGEPSKGPIGSLIRQILTGRTIARGKRGEAIPFGNEIISLLFAADRLDHCFHEIQGQQADGLQVISDRYVHSSLMYQGLDGDQDWIRTLNQYALIPDITYVLDVPASTAAVRRRSARSGEELYEQDAVQQQLEQEYRRLPQLFPDEQIVIVDGAQDVERVHRCIAEDLSRRYGWT